MPSDKTICDHVHTEQGVDDTEGNTDSLQMSHGNDREVARIREEIAESEYILFAVHICEEASQSYWKIRQADIGRKSDGDDEIDAALEKYRYSKNRNELVQQMTATVFPKDFHIDNPSFAYATTEHRIDEIQRSEIVDALPNRVRHFKRDDDRNGAGNPDKLPHR